MVKAACRRPPNRRYSFACGDSAVDRCHFSRFPSFATGMASSRHLLRKLLRLVIFGYRLIGLFKKAQPQLLMQSRSQRSRSLRVFLMR